MWLRQRPRLGNIPFPALEPHKGDGMGMEWQGEEELSGTGACDKQDVIPIESFKIEALITQPWLVFIPLAFMGDELDEGGDALLFSPKGWPPRGVGSTD